MKLSLPIAIIVLFPVVARCQILNIDKTDTSAYQHTSKVSGQLNAGLEIDKQKSTLYDATNTAEFMRLHYRGLFILAASYRFTYNGPDDILNAGFVHLKYRYGYKNKIQPEPFVQFQWDNSRGLEHRFLAGLNGRYNFWSGNTFELNAGLGFMYEDEEWNYNGVDSSKIVAGAVPVSRQVGKVNSYIRLDWKPGSNNEVTFNIFLQTRPNTFKPRLAPSLQWNIKAGKHIAFSITFSGMYDVAPVVPIQNFYYSLANSLLFSF